MKTLRNLSLTFAFSAVVTSAAQDCKTLCEEVKKVARVKTACGAFRNALPRPKVARYCLQGFRAAIDDNCNDACSNGGTIRSFIVDNRLDQTCSHALEDRPRPLCHDSCVQGYRAGVEDTLIALAKIIPQVKRTISSTSEKGGSILEQYTQSNRIADAHAEQPNSILSSVDGAVTSIIEGSQYDNDGTRYTSKIETDYVEQEDIQRDPDDNGYSRVFPQELGEFVVATHTKPEAAEEGQMTDVLVTESNENIEPLREPEPLHRENKLVLSLPITVDDVEKELSVFEDEEPVEVVHAFCREHMPDEGFACVNQLLSVVEDELVNTGIANSPLTWDV